MEDGVSFFSRFIETEFTWLKSLYSEPDELFLEKQEALLRLCHPIYTLAPDREPGTYEEIKAWYAGKIDKIAPRRLFQVIHYGHPEHGHIYRGYVSNNSTISIEDYGNNLFLGKIEGENRIISCYQRGSSPHEKGVIEGMDGWFYNTGIYFKTLGELLEIKKITPPEDENNRADYGSI